MTDTQTTAIERCPKAELHLHVEGSLEPQMVLHLVDRNGLDYRHKSVAEIVATYEFANLAAFGAVYQANAAVLVTERDFYDLTAAYMKRVREDNVVHAEIAVSPQGALHRGVAPELVIEGVLAGFEDAKRDFGMTGGVIVGAQRQRGPEDGLAVMRRMKPYRDRIMAVGLASMEVGFPPAPFAAMFIAWMAMNEPSPT